ncbi:MAG TPA: FAD-dependent oxidoreductase [Lacipirellulaceae bacterium]|nr:FAD-dependent oxidoreductase [Lacipirellulaceae bacterium]
MESNLQPAEFIIIGGGAVGCAVAYSLAKAGKTNVLLLEKEPTVAAVTTPQAAGLVGQVRNSVERTKLAMWSVKTFAQLERDTEARPGWRQVGSLRVALCPERAAEFKHMKEVADKAGLEAEFIDRRTAEKHWPMMNFERAEAVLWCPSDGYLQPSDLTMSYVALARRMGVRFQTRTAVRRVVVKDGRVAGIETDGGTIECRMVINAAGAHAYHIAKSIGLELPIVPVRHEYFVTVHAEGLRPDLPVVRIPDSTLYLRAEINSLLCGGWERSGLSSDPRQFALDGQPPPIDPDWDVLGWFAEQLAPEIPQVEELGVRSVFRGWPTFTPDGRFIVGESSRVKGFVMAGGCNAHGVSGSAGIGRHVVESILEPDASPYVKSLSPDRFSERWDWQTARRQAQHYYETYYDLGH